jgi:predicted nucleic acid-binding protein
MLIYLDMCSIHRPLDDKTQLRIQVESEAVLAIIALCESGPCELVSSDALEYEAGRNPRAARKAYARDVLGHARRFVELSPEVEERARAYNEAGLKPLDALHLSCAVEAGAEYLCTCDDRFLKRAKAVHSGPPKVVNPLELIREIGA